MRTMTGDLCCSLSSLPLIREQQLASLQRDKEYDVLIIGGGVTGCGTALDSTLRGKWFMC